MFWEVWKNVASATTSWSLGGSGGGGGAKKGLPSSSSSSAHKTRYNRLNGRPTKSQSQPANLTSLASYSSSSESLTGSGARGDNDEDNEHAKSLHPQSIIVLKGAECRGESHTSDVQDSCDLLGLGSHFPPNNNSSEESGTSTNNLPRGKSNKKNSNGMKHSFSSFFPFTSCATTTSANSPPPASSSSSGGDRTGKFHDLDQQQNDQHNASSFSPGETVTTTAPSTTNGNGGMSCWDLDVKKETGPGNFNENEEDEISDLDDEVEHLTCDVCERAFPTLKLLARHQRKKRHYGCLQCDSIFPSREVLECHREQMCHYDYAIDVYDEDEDEENFFESDDDEHGLRECDEDCDDEERERLL